ncbi:MAG: NAD(+)/NADH kinase [Deltaproteobacteria bacterium]|nr:NAD(+)/NADH kinase [Deltaproteobacteria bacterium]
MSTIGLVVRPGVDAAKALAEQVLAWAKGHGHSIIIEEESAKVIGAKEPGVPGYQLAVKADPIVTLGGDGTLIGVARYVTKRSPLLIGVNFGNLGFLTELTPAELLPTLEKFFSDGGKSLPCGERSMIFCEVIRSVDGAEKCVFSSQAVNDVVIQKGTQDKLMDIDFAVDSEDVMRLRADGLIISTPTGSTAYSLAAGGSIVHPLLSVVLVTPICPHSLTSRPLVLSLDARLTVRLPRHEGSTFLSIDGQVSVPLFSGDRVQLTRAENVVRFARSPSKSYFEILRTKLNWGIGNKSE